MNWIEYYSSKNIRFSNVKDYFLNYEKGKKEILNDIKVNKIFLWILKGYGYNVN